MCECHQPPKQCQLTNEKIKEKATEERGFALMKHETFASFAMDAKASHTASWDVILSPPWVQPRRWISMGSIGWPHM
jgi:hypothetical protein